MVKNPISSLRPESTAGHALWQFRRLPTRRAGIFVQPAFFAHQYLKNDRSARNFRAIETLLQTRIMQGAPHIPGSCVVHLADL